jgi:hypothetical protein
MFRFQKQVLFDPKTSMLLLLGFGQYDRTFLVLRLSANRKDVLFGKLKYHKIIFVSLEGLVVDRF